MADTSNRRREPKGIPVGGRFAGGNGGGADASDLDRNGGGADMERRREAIMAAARAQLVASKGRRAEVFDDLEIRARVNGVEREYRLSDAPDSVVMAASSGTRSHGHATVMGMRPTFKHSKQAEAAVGFVSRRFGDGARWADIPERHREGIVDARVERMVSIEHGVVHVNTRAEETVQRLRDLEYARYEQSARDMRELGGAGYALDESDNPGGMWAPDAPDEEAQSAAIAENASRDSREPVSLPVRRTRPVHPFNGEVRTRRMTDEERAAFHARHRPVTDA